MSHISKDKLAKSQAYGRDKALFSLFSLAWSQAFEFALVYSNGFAHIWDYSQNIIGPNYTGGVSLRIRHGLGLEAMACRRRGDQTKPS